MAGIFTSPFWSTQIGTDPAQTMSSINLPQYTPQHNLTNQVSLWAQKLQPTTAQQTTIASVPAPNVNITPGTIASVPAPNVNITPQQIQRIKLPDIGKIDTTGLTVTSPTITYQPNAKAGNVAQYFDPATLQQDIYSGLSSQIWEEEEKANKQLQETMANTGLYRSGLTLANQQELEQNTLNALGIAWGQTAYNVAALQSDLAKTQASLDTQTNIANEQIRSDLEKTNATLRTQANIVTAQNLLQAKITEYNAAKELAIEQGRLDEAVDFANAQNNLQAQLSMLQANMDKYGIQTDVAKTQAGLETQANIATAQTNLDKYGIQADIAKTQAGLTQEVQIHNADVQNAFATHKFDSLMNVAAIDQDAINQAQQFNISIQNAYDELAFKWAASLLDQEIREYASKLDLIAKAQAANAQYGTEEAKNRWNTLAYQYAQSLNTSTLEAPAYNNAVADLTNQINQLQGQVNSLQSQNQQLQNQLNTLRQPQPWWWRIIDGA